MKTTLDLPDELLRQMNLRAVREGRNVEEVVADMLAAGLSPASNDHSQNDVVASKNLPLIKVRSVQPADVQRLTTQDWCDWIKDVDLQLEIERYEKALGHQYVDRADA